MAELPPGRPSALQKPFASLLGQSMLSAVSQQNSWKQPALGVGWVFCTCAFVHKHLTYKPLLPQRGQWLTQDILHGGFFLKTHFFSLLPGSPTVGSQTRPIHKWQGKNKERHSSPAWQVAGLINKGTYLQGLSWVTTRSVDLNTHCPKLKSL